MPDLKISGLTALTAADTADLLEIVDVSDTTMAATGTNKKITAGQVLASGLPGSFSTLAASGATTLASSGVNNATTIGATTPPSSVGTLQHLLLGYGTFASQLVAGGEFDLGWNFYYFGGWKSRVNDVAIKCGYNSVASGRYSISFAPAPGAADAALTFTEALGVSSTGLAVTGAVSPTLNVIAASGKGVDFSAFNGVAAGTAANILTDYDQYTAASAACTGAITTAAVWKLTKVGNKVTLTLPAVTGTASATTNFLFGVLVPAKYRPSEGICIPCLVKDNGAVLSAPGFTSVGSDGAIRVYKDLVATANFTAASAAGLGQGAGFSVSWTI